MAEIIKLSKDKEFIFDLPKLKVLLNIESTYKILLSLRCLTTFSILFLSIEKFKNSKLTV